MESIAVEMEVLLSRCQRMIENVKRELQLCPGGTLMSAIVNGKPGYFRVDYDNQKRRRTLISNDRDEIRALLRKEYLNRQLVYLQNAEREINNAAKRICEPDDMPLQSVMKKHKWLDEELLTAAQHGPSYSSWADEPYEQYTRYPEGKIHRTSRGPLVRSKSEVLIAESLYKACIPFRYEQILHIAEFSYAPDFTIRRSDGKIFFWEHQGRMFDTKYMDRHFSKMRVYFAEGIVPWDNLILTYDSFDGRVDVREIETQIKQKLII